VSINRFRNPDDIFLAVCTEKAVHLEMFNIVSPLVFQERPQRKSLAVDRPRYSPL